MHLTYEVNFDGLVGPTYNFAGLSYGNIASIDHRYAISNPREAALQGLKKIELLFKLGLKQGILPPQPRPSIEILRHLGFNGTDAAILQNAYQTAPQLFFACSSAAAMWAANSATVTPSSDSKDGRLHITPANLSSKLHRSLEPPLTAIILGKIFSDPRYFCHHPALPAGNTLADEGAANHTRFCKEYGGKGVHLFVYGREALNHNNKTSKKYPARQTREASEAIARQHGLELQESIFAQQNPEAIDLGVFHNDVISVGNQHFFLYHESAFIDSPTVIEKIRKQVQKISNSEMFFFPISEEQLTIKEAVESYLFNSQIVSLPNQRTMAFIAPSECAENNKTRELLDRLIASQGNPISEIHYSNLKQSMQNGGGPACLRLRVVLTEEEIGALHQNILLDESLYEQLVGFVKRNYRDRLHPSDLCDPQLLEENNRSLDELTQILNLGSIYPFQK